MVISNDEIIEVKKEAFLKNRFDALDLTEKQTKAMEVLVDDQTDELLFGGSAGGGKSWIGSEWLLWSCLCYPGSNWFIGRKTLKTIKKSTLKTFHKVAKKHGIRIGIDYKVNDKDSFIRFNNGKNGFVDGSNIDLLELKFKPSDEDYEDFGSLEYTGGWIEEGGEVHQAAYDVLGSRIGRHLNDIFGLSGKLLVTCNPRRNWMYRKFYKPWKDGLLELTKKFIQSFATENNKLDKDYVRRLNKLTGSKRKRLRLGEWDYDEDPLKLIEGAAIEAIPYNERVAKGRRCITADIALHGSDLFVVVYWDGFRAEETVFVPKCDADIVEFVIKDVAQRNNITSNRDICVDADGIGSFLKGYLKGVVSFIANSKPIQWDGDQNYATLNDQVIYKICERINSKEVYINTDNVKQFIPKTKKYEPANGEYIFETIAEELGAQKEEETFERKLKVISKKQIKQDIGHSPDYFDTIKMREYLEIMPVYSGGVEYD